jgi:leucyl/phenylalanyl-tRNA--protein transferase
MPVYRLDKRLIFTPPELAEKDGLLAVGGDLGRERLLLAYSMGIFPWFSDGSPILWWSPDPRLVLFPDELKISRSLRQVIRKGEYTVTTDTDFEGVIRNCAEMRRGKKGEGTWITDEMIKAYMGLHRTGDAHSVESRFEGKLAGGLYGLSMGQVFFGESMFSKRSNASKVALAELVSDLKRRNFRMIDCQVRTAHLMSLGAREIPRDEFLRILKESIKP